MGEVTLGTQGERKVKSSRGNGERRRRPVRIRDGSVKFEVDLMRKGGHHGCVSVEVRG